MVPVRKKNGEIRLCIDFRNLNRASLKDNYPLPKMDHILQRVVGATRISMLDGFSGYNQVLVDPKDQEKTTFITHWDTFMYAKMPFGLMNDGATFHRAMDIAFAEDINKFVVIYLDDIMVYSRNESEHVSHLRKIFLKCRKYDISLNPKKSNFAMMEGKLLGHITSEEGVRIDPNRVTAIQNLDFPRTRKEIQSFLGTINFVRRFVPNFAEIIRPISHMLKKDSVIEWTVEAKATFDDIKKVIFQAPVLTNLDFAKYFLIFTFASKHTIVGVLLQKNSEGREQPIAFYSTTLGGSDLKYNIMEKKAFALIRALKEFRVYIMQSHIIAFVPNSVVKEILT